MQIKQNNMPKQTFEEKIEHEILLLKLEIDDIKQRLDSLQIVDGRIKEVYIGGRTRRHINRLGLIVKICQIIYRK